MISTLLARWIYFKHISNLHTTNQLQQNICNLNTSELHVVSDVEKNYSFSLYMNKVTSFNWNYFTNAAELHPKNNFKTNSNIFLCSFSVVSQLRYNFKWNPLKLYKFAHVLVLHMYLTSLNSCLNTNSVDWRINLMTKMIFSR